MINIGILLQYHKENDKEEQVFSKKKQTINVQQDLRFARPIN